MKAAFIATAAEVYLRQAVTELRERDRSLSGVRAMAPGVIRFDSGLSREALLETLLKDEPVFVRHVHPVDLQLPLSAALPGTEAVLAAAAALLDRTGAGTRIAVQVRRLASDSEAGEAGPLGTADRAELRTALDREVVREGREPVTRGADWILSVTVDSEAVHMGLSTPAENLSDWPGGEVRFRREEGQLSRAKFKLLEALEKFRVPLTPGSRALDLGAAPGGWTSLLLERGLRVTAVDTGKLGEGVRAHPELVFLRRNADEVTFPEASFDLVTCDLSWNPLRTAEMVARLAPSARSGAHGILTVKLMLDNPTRTIRRVKDLLAGTFTVLQVKQLFHNRDEVTMHLLRV